MNGIQEIRDDKDIIDRIEPTKPADEDVTKNRSMFLSNGTFLINELEIAEFLLQNKGDFLFTSPTAVDMRDKLMAEFQQELNAKYDVELCFNEVRKAVKAAQRAFQNNFANFLASSAQVLDFSSSLFNGEYGKCTKFLMENVPEVNTCLAARGADLQQDIAKFLVENKNDFLFENRYTVTSKFKIMICRKQKLDYFRKLMNDKYGSNQKLEDLDAKVRFAIKEFKSCFLNFLSRSSLEELCARKVIFSSGCTQYLMDNLPEVQAHINAKIKAKLGDEEESLMPSLSPEIEDEEEEEEESMTPPPPVASTSKSDAMSDLIDGVVQKLKNKRPAMGNWWDSDPMNPLSPKSKRFKRPTMERLAAYAMAIGQPQYALELSGAAGEDTITVGDVARKNALPSDALIEEMEIAKFLVKHKDIFLFHNIRDHDKRYRLVCEFQQQLNKNLIQKMTFGEVDRKVKMAAKGFKVHLADCMTQGTVAQLIATESRLESPMIRYMMSNIPEVETFLTLRKLRKPDPVVYVDEQGRSRIEVKEEPVDIEASFSNTPRTSTYTEEKRKLISSRLLRVVEEVNKEGTQSKKPEPVMIPPNFAPCSPDALELEDFYPENMDFKHRITQARSFMTKAEKEIHITRRDLRISQKLWKNLDISRIVAEAWTKVHQKVVLARVQVIKLQKSGNVNKDKLTEKELNGIEIQTARIETLFKTAEKLFAELFAMKNKHDKQNGVESDDMIEVRPGELDLKNNEKDSNRLIQKTFWMDSRAGDILETKAFDAKLKQLKEENDKIKREALQIRNENQAKQAELRRLTEVLTVSTVEVKTEPEDYDLINF